MFADPNDVSSPIAASDRPPRPGRPPRILDVDDDALVRRLIRVSLGPGYEVYEAGDGPEALLRTAREKPDLILLDLNLPQLSGFDVCRAIRAEPQDPPARVVVVTVRG